MKRIAMIVWNEFLNDARVLKEAQTLQAAGYQVIVHALHTPGVTQQKETLPCGVNVIRVVRSPLWRLRKGDPVRAQRKGTASWRATNARIQHIPRPPPETPLRQLFKLVARSWTHACLIIRLVRSRPDAIHAHDVNVLPTAWLAATLTHTPLIYDAHEISTDREGYRAFRGLVGWLEKRIMPRAAGTITTTEARAKFFARAYRIQRPLVLQNRPRYTAPGGLETERSSRIRDTLGLSMPWPIVLYQGGLQPGRGLMRLVEAAADVPSAYFVFIGDGRLVADLHDRVAMLSLKERVHFIPTVPLDMLPAYTASADIGVQPIENTCLNHFTTDSNKLFEYVIGGLAVVASDMPEIARIVRHHELGVLVPPGDTAALAVAIRTLVDDAPMLAHYRDKASRAAESLNWESQEASLIALYARILA